MAEPTPASSSAQPRSASEQLEQASEDELATHGVSIELPAATQQDGRPLPVKHISTPAYQSHIRHHKRAPSRSKAVKETLDAHSHYGSNDDDGGASVHRINQYIIKQEIGRGSFGAVHLASDQYGHEFAVKEFSKSRLRKRAQSNLLRKPNGTRRPEHHSVGLGFNSPMHRVSFSDWGQDENNNALSLIKEEIAIMKKLNHNNLVSLIEVLDDPQEDSLYMVLEYCKKGVAMGVNLDVRADPYDDETCRCWFRDMILGIEYLHAQGIIHRDIKPDNCLITEDDVLKIVDFGVSEMFEKDSEMATAKSAGSPAFMPPELCVAKHGSVNGRAVDIWSMGVTLYCLRYGCIPFEKSNILDLYESIRSDDTPLENEQDPNFADLMRRILCKDPDARITMEELKVHPWVTKDGADELLSTEENCADLVEPPTEAEKNHAITGNMGNLMVVMKAVNKFKKIVHEKHGQFMGGLFGKDSRIVVPPDNIHRSRSTENDDRRPLEKELTVEGVHRDVPVDDDLSRLPRGMDRLALNHPADFDVVSQTPRAAMPESLAMQKQRKEANMHHPHGLSSGLNEHHAHSSLRSNTFPLAEHEHPRGQAHNPLEDEIFLNIGPNPEATDMDGAAEHEIVSESPPQIDMNIYEQAYEAEMNRVLEHKGNEASLYMNRRVEHRDDIRVHESVKDAGKKAVRSAAAKLGTWGSKGENVGEGIGEGSTYAARRTLSSFAGGVMDMRGPANEFFETHRETARLVAGDRTGASKAAAQSVSTRIGGLMGKPVSPGEGFSDWVKRAQAQAQTDGEPAIADPEEATGAATRAKMGSNAEDSPGIVSSPTDYTHHPKESAHDLPGSFPQTPPAHGTST